MLTPTRTPTLTPTQKIKFKYISYKLYIIKNNHIPPYYALLIHYQQNKKNLISSQMDSQSFPR